MKSKGFTLIELLIIIAIIGILVGIAATAGRAAMDRVNVEKIIKELNSDLTNAQVSSMQRSRMHFVLFTPTTYTIFEDTGGGPVGDGVQGPGDRQVKQVAVSPRYAMTIPLGNQVIFTRRGMAELLGGPIVGQVNIQVNQGFGSPLDCIAITQARTRAGSWNTAGGTCLAQ